jgi:hypothetical protein
MTQLEIMGWYKNNLFTIVVKAIEEKKKDNPNLLYTPDWLIAMAYRETWTLLITHIKNRTPFKNIEPKGDYGRRQGELEKQFHGFGYFQIDIGSYPEFVKSGDWKDPYKCTLKAIEVLEEKRQSIEKSFPNLDNIEQAITAAYNSGQGNVLKAIKKGADVDTYTHEKNYSKMVWEYRKLFNSLT